MRGLATADWTALTALTSETQGEAAQPPASRSACASRAVHTDLHAVHTDRQSAQPASNRRSRASSRRREARAGSTQREACSARAWCARTARCDAGEGVAACA
eukprot:3383616-Pleurochrysis_carterae.AAC.1